MNTKKTSDDVLPDCWIRKQSKSRPDHIYYYNTATRQSQWNLPVSAGDKQQKQLTKKGPAESPKGSDKIAGKSFRISDHSKQIKKRQSKTPAQDRLQNLVTEIKNSTPVQGRSRNVDTSSENATPAQNRLQNFDTTMKNSTESRKVAGKAEHYVDLTKSTSDNVPKSSLNQSSNNPYRAARAIIKPRPAQSNKRSVVVSTTSDEIPSLFPPKTPIQDRLNRLRSPEHNQTLNNESSLHSLSVIQSEFGLSSSISDDKNQSTTIGEDEPMDWEPCDIFEEIENVVHHNIPNPYIIPDTNVFLDDLYCIRDTIYKDATYNVLVPFVVLQELDRLKGRQGDSRIAHLASNAIRFIYNELKSKTQRLQGQKATEDRVHLIDVVNADDKILNCCLQMLRQSQETILVSNDINLCNKAIASGITTMTAKEYKANCH